MAVEVTGAQPQRQLPEGHPGHGPDLQGPVRGDAELRPPFLLGVLCGVVGCLGDVCVAVGVFGVWGCSTGPGRIKILQRRETDGHTDDGRTSSHSMMASR